MRQDGIEAGKPNAPGALRHPRRGFMLMPTAGRIVHEQTFYIGVLYTKIADTDVRA